MIAEGEAAGRARLHAHLMAASACAMVAGLILAAVGGFAYPGGAFSGTMRIAQGGEERVALCPGAPEEGGGQAGPAHLTRGVPGAAVPIAGAPVALAAIDPAAYYDVATLPFSLRLDSVEILDAPKLAATIEVAYPDEKKTYSIEPGQVLALEGAPALHITAIRRWAGLLQEETGGAPIASFAARKPDGQWVENLFIPSKAWAQIDAQASLHWEWAPNENAARQAIREAVPPALESARWGVRDGDRMTWFESFLPGTGVDLADGRSVTLIALDEHHTDEATPPKNAPAIQIEIKPVSEGNAGRQWVFANANDDKSLVAFEYPALSSQIIVAFSWRDSHAIVTAFKQGAPCGAAELEAGAIWRPDGWDREVRLDQAFASAVAVIAEKSPLFEAVVEPESTAPCTLRLREGEAVRYGDLMLRFVREVSPPAVRYSLTVHDQPAGTSAPLVLDPGDTFTRRGWRITQGSPDACAREIAVLVVERRGASMALRSGLCLAAIGLLGLALAASLKKNGKNGQAACISRNAMARD